MMKTNLKFFAFFLVLNLFCLTSSAQGYVAPPGACMFHVVATSLSNDNDIAQYPHRSLGGYSDAAIAYWDADLGELNIAFNESAESATILIYKDGALVSETAHSIDNGTQVSFDLSTYGSGSYTVVIYGIGETDLYGTFDY